MCLNPSLAGTYSWTGLQASNRETIKSLNPSLAGTYSRTNYDNTIRSRIAVLILLWLEHTLGPF